MQTIRLFKENVYLKEAEAVITSRAERDGALFLTLDRTIFFPGGGGQSCDLGTVSGFPLAEVYEHEGEIYHKLIIPQDMEAEAAEVLREGAVVLLVLDWGRRFDNMQRHCGEHILTGIFYREWGGINRGFHMGEDYMSIDISLETGAQAEVITWEMCLEAERLANEVVAAALPMITRHFYSFEEANSQPMRKKLTIKEDITLVGIGSVEYDWGCAACCGTHPSSTAQVGLIKIFKLESNKGMYRIYFEAGKRAFEKYQQQFEILRTLCNSLSAGAEDVLEKFRISREKDKEIRSELHFLKKEIIAREAASIIEELRAPEATQVQNPPDKVLSSNRLPNRLPNQSQNQPQAPRRRYSLLSLDDLVSLSREISPEVKKIYFLVHEPTHTVLLVSDGKTDCGKLVKENASIYNGKGGGNKTMARAIFAKGEYVDTFIDLIEKHLR